MNREQNLLAAYIPSCDWVRVVPFLELLKNSKLPRPSSPHILWPFYYVLSSYHPRQIGLSLDQSFLKDASNRRIDPNK